MSRLYEELADRIRGEAADLDRLVQRAPLPISLSKQLEFVDA